MDTNDKAALETAKQDAHVGRMEKRLRSWGGRLDELIAKVDGAGSDAQADYRKGVDDLKAKLQVAKDRIGDFKTAGNGKWESFKNDIDIAWKDLEVAFKRLKK